MRGFIAAGIEEALRFEPPPWRVKVYQSKCGTLYFEPCAIKTGDFVEVRILCTGNGRLVASYRDTQNP